MSILGKPEHCLGTIWAQFRPYDKFCSRPIKSAYYYALTFSEKIRKNQQAETEII